MSIRCRGGASCAVRESCKPTAYQQLRPRRIVRSEASRVGTVSFVGGFDRPGGIIMESFLVTTVSSFAWHGGTLLELRVRM